MNDLRVESVIPKRMFLVPLTCLSSGRLPRVSEYNTDDYSFNGTMQLLLNKDFSLIKDKKRSGFRYSSLNAPDFL